MTPEDFEHIYHSLYRPLFLALIKKVNREDAEDIIIESFLNLWQYKDKVQNPGAYVRVCAMNAMKKMFKTKKIEFTYLNEGLDYEESQQDTIWIDKIKEAIEKLPNQRRKVIELSFFEDYSHKEIVNELAISSKTVFNHRLLGIGSIKKMLSVK